MKPYYDHGGITLYHGDCQEILRSQDCEERFEEAMVMVTDPPYGIAWSKGLSATRSSRAHSGILNDHDTSVRDTALLLWDALGLPSLVFGSLYAPYPLNVRHILIWEKPNDAGVFGSRMGYRRDVEAIFLRGPWPHRFAQRGSVVRSKISNAGGSNSPAGRTGHPHAKPVDLLCNLLLFAPTGVVVDPFMGSGSTLIAAKNLGRRAIGIEIEERYCEIAANRLSQEVLGL